MNNILFRIVLLLLCSTTTMTVAQPNNPATDNTYLIVHVQDSEPMRGTCFLVLYKGNSYLVTASHVLHKPKNNDRLNFYFKNYLAPGYVIDPQFNFSGTVFVHKNDNVDIAVIPFKPPGERKALQLAPMNYNPQPLDPGGMFGFPIDAYNYQQPISLRVNFLAIQNYGSYASQLFFTPTMLDEGLSGAPIFMNSVVGNEPRVIGVHVQTLTIQSPGSEIEYRTNLTVGHGVNYLYEILDSILN